MAEEELQKQAGEEQQEKPAPSVKIPLFVPVLVGLAMFAAAIWGGGEMARAEIAQQTLEAGTARAHLVRVLVTVPAGTVVHPDMLEEVETYANRVEPYCLTKAGPAVGRKTKFGLEQRQILTVQDLE